MWPTRPGRPHPQCRSSQFRAADAMTRCPEQVILFNYGDRKSTRLNSSHLVISYAVFCLKKKNKTHKDFFIHLELMPSQITNHIKRPMIELLVYPYPKHTALLTPSASVLSPLLPPPRIHY